MLFFGKKKKDHEVASPELLARINGKSLRYVTRREEGDYTETVVGKGGGLSVREGDVIVVCDNGVILKKPVSELVIGELLSRDGATFDYIEEGRKITVVAYYTYYRKVN